MPVIQHTRVVFPRRPNIWKPVDLRKLHSVASFSSLCSALTVAELRVSQFLQTGEQPGNVGEACLDRLLNSQKAVGGRGRPRKESGWRSKSCGTGLLEGRA